MLIPEKKIIKFETLFFVKASLITLYLALTFPIPFISIDGLNTFSIFIISIGLILIINLTTDYVITNDRSIYFKTSRLSKIFGKYDWIINWENIKKISSFSTSQGSQVHYFITNEGNSYLIPQRIKNLDEFKNVINTMTQLDTKCLNYISPLWTYKLLIFLSMIMLIAEIFFIFYLKGYPH